MACRTGPCPSCTSNKKARALPKDPKKVNEYVEQVRQLFKERKLPDLSQSQVYRVYHIRSSPIGGHSSIVVTHDDKTFTTVELAIVKVDGENTVYPLSRPYTGDRAKLEYCGSVEKTGYELFREAVETMENFGAYDYFFNNCQNYANDYLKKLKLKAVQTGPEKVTASVTGCASYYGN